MQQSVETKVKRSEGSLGAPAGKGALSASRLTPHASPVAPAASRLPPHASRLTAQRALAAHWPEYLMEAAGLGFFMLSACLFTILLEHPGSVMRQALPDPLLRRALIGVAMGLTAIAIIYSPFGKRSGAHLNPSVTFAFWRLGKIEGWDAVFYVVAQFVGGAAGVLLAAVLCGPMLIAHDAVNYAVTRPGEPRPWAAFGAELVISFGLMLTVLVVSNRRRLNRYTGLFAGMLVALYITFEAPLSGMSMNPARTVASALPAAYWAHAWLYFVAPPLGMLLAAEAYVRSQGKQSVLCCKLHHENASRCIFRCNYGRHGGETA
jgi:aquaporin Z